MRNLTRRQFLAGSAGIAASLGVARTLAPQSVFADDFPDVAVCQGTNADSAAALLKTAMDAVGGMGRFVKPGQTVAIKPNATWDYPPGTASSTDPDLLKAVIALVAGAGAKRIIVVDHPTLSAASECLQVSGIGAALKGLDVEQVFPDRSLAPASTYTTIDLPNGKAYQSISVIKAAAEADVRINMAVAKTHVVLPVTLCLKHMMGFLESPPGLHANLEQGITDINGKSAIWPALHILEAIRIRTRGMAAGTGNELTDPQKVKRINQMVVGTDPVLIDSYACINYFSRQPKEIRYIQLAGDQGLGRTDVKQATAEGRLRIYKVGGELVTPATVAPSAATTQPITPTATATATTQATATPDTSPTAEPATGTPDTAGAATATSGPTTTPLPPTATATTPATATPLPPTPLPPTNTPLPTGTLEAPTPAAIAAADTRCASVISPNSLLSTALLPVAAIVAGAGAVVGGRLKKGAEEQRGGGAEEKRSGGGGEKGSGGAEGQRSNEGGEE